MHPKSFLLASLFVTAAAFAPTAQEAPLGSPSTPNSKEKQALESFKGKVKGKIVWSSSRSSSKHDIWIMNADGTCPMQLTKSPNAVDWFPRFSPDGKSVLFTRSKSGWVKEMDAEQNDLWDIWSVSVDGSNERKVASDACWGTWRPDGKNILFARCSKVFMKDLDSPGTSESEVFDAEGFFGKKKVYAQQPELSSDGKFLSMTVRGAMRETGIFNVATKKWNSTGGGCEITWFPDTKAVLRVNEGQGNGGTEILRIPIDTNGAPTVRTSGLTIPKELRFMDLPGRRSHEYFPRIDQKRGKWLVFCATQYGHEHDIADYEVYIWDVTTDKEKDFVRLTFHTANDRWPDIFVE